MEGQFGVFCGNEMVAGVFGNDIDADEHMRDMIECGRRYDAWELEVREVSIDDSARV